MSEERSDDWRAGYGVGLLLGMGLIGGLVVLSLIKKQSDKVDRLEWAIDGIKARLDRAEPRDADPDLSPPVRVVVVNEGVK